MTDARELAETSGFAKKLIPLALPATAPLQNNNRRRNPRDRSCRVK